MNGHGEFIIEPKYQVSVKIWVLVKHPTAGFLRRSPTRETLACMTAQNPPPGSVPPFRQTPEAPAGGPPGYGQPAPASSGNKTALLMILALVVGLLAGGLIAWPIFSSSDEEVAAGYDVRVLAAAADRADPTMDALDEAGRGLMSAVSRVDLELMDESLNDIQDVCNARD